MSNYRRWRVEGGIYFFTAVTFERQSFLVEPIPRQLLRTAIESVRQRYPFEILAWVSLPDHLHTVWALPSGDFNYSVRWRQIKTLFSQAYLRAEPKLPPANSNRTRRGEHNVWQRRFFEHTCRDESDLKRCIDYVHVNPLKHGLVQRVQDWPWSTFHRYVQLGEYDRAWGNAHEWFGDEFRDAE